MATAWRQTSVYATRAGLAIPAKMVRDHSNDLTVNNFKLDKIVCRIRLWTSCLDPNLCVDLSENAPLCRCR